MPYRHRFSFLIVTLFLALSVAGFLNGCSEDPVSTTPPVDETDYCSYFGIALEYPTIRPPDGVTYYIYGRNQTFDSTGKMLSLEFSFADRDSVHYDGKIYNMTYNVDGQLFQYDVVINGKQCHFALAVPPAPPYVFLRIPFRIDAANIRLTWSKSASNRFRAYEVRMSLNESSWDSASTFLTEITNAADTTFVATSAPQSGKVFFRVYLKSTDGVSVASNTVALDMDFLGRFYGDQQSEFIYALAEGSDGSVVLVGSSAPAGYKDRQLLLKRMNRDGVVLNETPQWLKRAGALYSIIQYNGGFTLCGFEGAEGYERASIYTLGNDVANGTAVLRSDRSVFHGLTAGPDGVLAVGAKYKPSGADRNGLFVKHSSGGSQEWETLLPGTEDSWCVAAAYSAYDKRYYAVGTLEDPAGDVLTVALSEAGSLKWSDTKGPGTNDMGTGLAALPLGGCIAIGYGYDWATQMDMYALRYPPGDIAVPQWEKTYGGPQSEIPTSVVAEDDGSLIIAGVLTDNAKRNIILTKIDSEGNQVWQRGIQGITNADTVVLTNLSAGGYALAGYMTGWYRDFFLIFLDDQGIPHL